jgi:hypothetical protein
LLKQILSIALRSSCSFAAEVAGPERRVENNVIISERDMAAQGGGDWSLDELLGRNRAGAMRVPSENNPSRAGISCFEIRRVWIIPLCPLAPDLVCLKHRRRTEEVRLRMNLNLPNSIHIRESRDRRDTRRSLRLALRFRRGRRQDVNWPNDLFARQEMASPRFAHCFQRQPAALR